MEWVLGLVIVLSVTRALAQASNKTHVLMQYPVLNLVTMPSVSVSLVAYYLYNKTK